MNVDYLVVGAGLTGATIARELSDAGREVMIVERRSHIGGNVHDFTGQDGVRVHTYGPHYFRTSSERLWQFVNRFGKFYTFKAVVKSLVDGTLQNWPITRSYIGSVIGENWKPAFTGKASNFEEASLALMPRPIYERFVRGYTEKQWGVPASCLSPSLVRRFDVRDDDNPFLVCHSFQGLPVDGYTAWIRSMLGKVTFLTNWDYLLRRSEIVSKRCLVFTGPIDEYFGFDLGRLKYRGQQRVHEYADCNGFFQPVVQVNNPDPYRGDHIRTIEWKHMMPPGSAPPVFGTTLTREYPFTPSDAADYEYPFPDRRNAELYSRYRSRAESVSGLLICGRLGEYRYYDMDQAIGRARVLAARLLSTDGKCKIRAATGG